MVQGLISNYQTIFFPGRLIGDNFLVAIEMVASFNRNSGGANATIKVDLAKAYDTYSWKALEDTLKEFEFLEQCIRLVMMCVSTSSLSFLVNWTPTKQFFPGRGFR